MKRAEAIIMLAVCKPLADRLAEHGVYIELTDVDRGVLANFVLVALDDWLDNPAIAEEAGLHPADVIMLRLMASRVRDEKMQRQHKGGEQLDKEI